MPISMPLYPETRLTRYFGPAQASEVLANPSPPLAGGLSEPVNALRKLDALVVLEGQCLTKLVHRFAENLSAASIPLEESALHISLHDPKLESCR